VSYPDDLTTFVLAVPGLEATGMYRVRLPRNVTLPAISWKRYYTETGLTHSGAMSLDHEYTELACCANSEEEAEALAGTLKAALHGYAGPLGDGWCHLAAVRQVRADAQPDLGQYYRLVPVDIYYREGDGGS